jgi:hypothetical protein
MTCRRPAGKSTTWTEESKVDIEREIHEFGCHRDRLIARIEQRPTRSSNTADLFTLRWSHA